MVALRRVDFLSMLTSYFKNILVKPVSDQNKLMFVDAGIENLFFFFKLASWSTDRLYLCPGETFYRHPVLI